MDRKFEVAIIGAGPAGMSAALYASRAGLKTLMIDRGAPGGKMMNTDRIDNYPGSVAIGGGDLAAKMFEQSTQFGCEYSYGDVTDLKDGESKEITLADDSKIYADKVIIATGTEERKLNVPGEKEFTGRGVSFCAVCDGAFYKGLTVMVIGGGNSALAEAIYLTKFAKKIYVVIRRDVFRATQVVQDELLKYPMVEVLKKKVPVKIIGEDKVTGIVLKDVDDNSELTVKVDGIFPYIGSDPLIGFTSHLDLKKDSHGYLIVDEEMKTNIEGIYAIGDVRAKELRQVVTAASDGAIAEEAINRNKH